MAVATWGDPTDRGRRSATATSLMEAIEAQGVGVIPVDSRPDEAVLAIGNALYSAGAYGSEWWRGRLVVRATQRVVDDAIRPKGAHTVLYVGSSLGLPRGKGGATPAPVRQWPGSIHGRTPREASVFAS
jgi:hypothetical protein